MTIMYKMFWITTRVNHKMAKATLTVVVILSVMSGINTNSVHMCPTWDCYCFHNKEIDCLDMELKRVPIFDVDNHTYQIIDLSKNKIKAFGANEFYNLRVEKLKMSKNKAGKNRVFTIHQNAFRGMEMYLQYLEMTENNIPTIPARVFRKMNKLKFLSLIHNKITTLPPMAFHGAENLESLNLIGNNINTIKGYTFRGLKHLDKLYLDNSNIVMVESKAFIGLRSLTRLTMSRNRIRHLQPNSFRKLDTLRTLDLSSNDLSALFPLMFRGLKSLENLDISSNPIVHIADRTFSSMNKLFSLLINKAKLSTLKSGIFKGLGNLKVIEISHNNLQDLPDDVFSNLNNLKKLRLDHNELKTLNPCAFKDIESVKDILVNGNKIHCDCALSWTSLKTTPSVFGMCYSPDKEKDKEISDPNRYTVCTFSGMECGNIISNELNEPLKLWIRYRRAYRQEPALFYGKRK